MKCLNIPCKVRLRVLRIVCACLCATGIILLALISLEKPPTAPPVFRKSLRVKYVKNVGNSTVACRLPSLDPFHDSVLKFVKNLGKLECKGKRFSSFDNNVLQVEGEGIVSAQYRKIGRPTGDDFNIFRSDPVPVPNLNEKSANQEQSTGFFSKIWNFFIRPTHKFLGNVKVEDDFIQVDVMMPWGKAKSDVHMHVFPKKEVLARPLKLGGIPLNVALIMFDSVSAANFRRKMPKSLEYLTNDLNSVLMQGETIVGDGTTAQLAAILTGIAESKQPEARRDMGDAAKPVDNWRWIFRDYKEKGYVTMQVKSDHRSKFSNLSNWKEEA